MLRNCRTPLRSSRYVHSLHRPPSFTSIPSRRQYASVTDLNNFPKPGSQIHGFTLKRTKHLPELQLSALHLEHDKTGAQYLHVARDDTNNVFSIGFKTNPPDDTGVPHILEHTTLCGSKQYPVRDPFFKMLPRSLSNFMNAFTSSDHTTYPFATTNAQDFKNLMSVYLDATLNPLLQANDFTQEGWRIGPENPLAAAAAEASDSTAKRLVFKGVVYNEMKGQMSDASYLYYIRYHDHLFPDINNSGGDPQKITDLTHEQLRQFHANHYHPSNAKIVTYGNLPLDTHAQSLDAILSRFDKIDTDRDIKTPTPLSDGPKYVTVAGPTDPLVPQNAQFKTSTTWLTTDTPSILETFSLGILSSILLDGYTSPLYRSLIESGLGADWSPNTGYDGSGKTGVFAVGLTGVKEEDVRKVKKTISETLQKVRKDGISKTKVDGILHQLELALKHKTANFGMGLIQRLKPGWFNGVDPFDILAWQEVITAFEKAYSQGGYLEDLLEKYFLNDRTLTFTMEPSSTYEQELADEENSRLASKILEVTKRFPNEERAREHLEKRELELLEIQEKGRNQDLSCLPTLRVKDINRLKERKELRHSTVDGVKVQWREAPTNGLTYFRAINVLKGLPDDLRELVPLFCDAIMRIGTKNRSMEQIEELIKLKTAGISVGYHSAPSPTSIEGYEEGIALSGSAFDRNIPHMYDLLRTVICETDFDSEHAERDIGQLLQSSASNAVNAVAESGHSYARGFAEAGLNPAASLREQVAGLSQVNLTTSLASRLESGSMKDVIAKLKHIQNLAVSRSRTMRVALTCGSESSNSNEEALKQFLAGLPQSNQSNLTTELKGAFLTRNAKTFFPLPYQVYYTGLALPTVPYTSPSGPALQILSQLLTHKHLHHEIREKGGAYGGGAYSSGLGGVFGFYSYRDPNPENTMRIFADAGRWAAEQNWTESDIEEAKLSVFQSIDAPRSVSQEGMTRFVSGVDEEMEQQRRERLLDVDAANVKEVASQFLAEGFQSQKQNVAVLGKRAEWVDKQGGWEVKNLNMADDGPEGSSDTGLS